MGKERGRRTNRIDRNVRGKESGKKIYIEAEPWRWESICIIWKKEEGKEKGGERKGGLEEA